MPLESDNRRDIGICMVLAVVTFAVFARLNRAEFLNYDDLSFVTENPIVRNGVTLPGLRWAMTARVVGNWHPLTCFSHMLDCQLLGPDNAGAHHMMNVALHVAVTLL